jgi:hypothetical protein
MRNNGPISPTYSPGVAIFGSCSGAVRQFAHDLQFAVDDDVDQVPHAALLEQHRTACHPHGSGSLSIALKSGSSLTTRSANGMIRGGATTTMRSPLANSRSSRGTPSTWTWSRWAVNSSAKVSGGSTAPGRDW